MCIAASSILNSSKRPLSFPKYAHINYKGTRMGSIKRSLIIFKYFDINLSTRTKAREQGTICSVVEI